MLPEVKMRAEDPIGTGRQRLTHSDKSTLIERTAKITNTDDN